VDEDEGGRAGVDEDELVRVVPWAGSSGWNGRPNSGLVRFIEIWLYTNSLLEKNSQPVRFALFARIWFIIHGLTMFFSHSKLAGTMFLAKF